MDKSEIFAAVGFISNVVVGFIGYLAKNAFSDLRTTVDRLVATSTATEKAVAVIETRFGGDIATLKEEHRTLRRRLDRIEGRISTGEWKIADEGEG